MGLVGGVGGRLAFKGQKTSLFRLTAWFKTARPAGPSYYIELLHEEGILIDATCQLDSRRRSYQFAVQLSEAMVLIQGRMGA